MINPATMMRKVVEDFIFISLPPLVKYHFHQGNKKEGKSLLKFSNIMITNRATNNTTAIRLRSIPLVIFISLPPPQTHQGNSE